jgi:hypothetical protein
MSELPGQSNLRTTPAYEVSERGFVHWSPVPTTYGHEVKVYESGAATDPPCMWLSIEKDDDALCAHLTHEQVREVHGRIAAWLERHHEAGARWAADRYVAELRAEFGLPVADESAPSEPS